MTDWKHYNILLEAVNRGIKMALDDFEDQEISGLKSGQLEDKSYTRESLWILQNFVDLGLPSRTLWYKYNLGATDPMYLGNEYQWAEIIHKQQKFSDINRYYENGKVLKYCCDENNGNRDDLIELQLEDDAAYQYDHRLRIPTREQFDELLQYTIPIYKLHKSSDNGVIFISKINGEKLFFPIKDNIGKSTSYWSSTKTIRNEHVHPFDANSLFLYPYGDQIWMSQTGRQNYLYIKPVLNR